MLRSLLVTSVLVLYNANISGDPLSSAHSMQCSSECCGHRLAEVSRQHKSHRRPVFDTQMNRLIHV
jgi:hypothetical protein